MAKQLKRKQQEIIQENGCEVCGLKLGHRMYCVQHPVYKEAEKNGAPVDDKIIDITKNPYLTPKGFNLRVEWVERMNKPYDMFDAIEFIEFLLDKAEEVDEVQTELDDLRQEYYSPEEWEEKCDKLDDEITEKCEEREHAVLDKSIEYIDCLCDNLRGWPEFTEEMENKLDDLAGKLQGELQMEQF